MTHQAAEFAAQVRRTADWLSGMPIERLDRAEAQYQLLSGVRQVSADILDLQLDLDPHAYGRAMTGADCSGAGLPNLKSAAVGAQLRLLASELLQSWGKHSRGPRETEQLAVLSERIKAIRM